MGDAKFRAQRGLATIQNRSIRFLDSYVPPDRRSDLLNRLQTWASQHPKLATLLALHTTLSLPPLLLFLLFATAVTTTTLLIALTTALALALTVSLLITTLVFTFFLLPTLILTTSAATALFVLAIITSTTSHWFTNSSNPRVESFRAGAAQRAAAAGERVKAATDGRVDANFLAGKVGKVGAPAVEGLAIYGEELAKMRNDNARGGSTPKASNSGGGGAVGGELFNDVSPVVDGESEALARQALGIPSAVAVETGK